MRQSIQGTATIDMDYDGSKQAKRRLRTGG